MTCSISLLIASQIGRCGVVMLALEVKSATAAPVARCEESWIASASLLVVSFPFRGKDIIEFLNV